MNAKKISLIVVTWAGISACTSPLESEDLYTGIVQQKVVSLAMQVTPAGDAFSGETATLVNQNGSTFHKVVAFNWDDPGLGRIKYEPLHRHVHTGVSLSGWSWSATGDSNGAFTPPQRLIPPTAWPILWGDPGIAQIPNTGYVFISTLAVPSFRAPQNGGALDDDMEQTAIGGGCVARSVNGGQTFNVSANDCLHDSPYSLYDGSDIVGTPSGAVYAAFNNVQNPNAVNNRIDVWMAPTATSAFTLLPNPFPTLQILGHPRMYTMDNSVAIVAPTTGGQLWLQIYDSGSGWRSTSAGFPRMVASDYNSIDVTIGGIPIRRGGPHGGAQFGVSWNLQYGSPGISDLLVPYAAQGAGHAIIKVAYCAISGTPAACSTGSTIDPGTNVFHPAIATTKVTNPPGPTYNVVSVLTWLQQVNTNQVEVMSTNNPLAGSITGRWEAGNQSVCSDTRGWWGDYDNHLGIYQPTPSSTPIFWRSFTDSTDSLGAEECYQRWRYQAGAVDVSATRISY